MIFVIAIVLAAFVLPWPIGFGVVVAAALFEVGEIAFWRRFLRRYRIATGAEALVGATAEVVEPLEPEGRVRIRGELWKARAEEAAGVGETVKVTAVDGLTLEVVAQRG